MIMIPTFKKICLTVCAATFALALVSCGGGDGDGNESENDVRGVWTGAVTKNVDTCAGSNAPQTLTFSHSVNQSGEAVTLINSNNVQYLGNVVSESGFSVDAAGGTQVIGNATCTTTNRIEYENIDNDDDNTAVVDIRALRDCGAGVSCELAYTGTATRNGGANPIATATAAPGTTPIAGGCAAIIEKTANGTYAGDGGCGLSEVVYRVTQSSTPTSVVLEPFGANGATSFAVSGASPAGATSARTDLTIKGEVGYSCSLACSAPSTFTVTCFKEGGVSCVEKF